MAKKFLQKAIKHPGRETRRAKEHGISLHQQLEKDAHSDNPSLRGAGNLGLRFQKHEFRPPASSNVHGYGHHEHQRHGSVRLSGDPGAHRIGRR